MTQDALIKVLTQLHRYNPEWKFTTWVNTITRNTCIDWIRKQSKKSWSEVPDVACENLLPDALVNREQVGALVHEALATLPQIYREVIELHHFQDLKYREIAQNLNVPIGTVMNRLFRARRKMRVAIELQAA